MARRPEGPVVARWWPAALGGLVLAALIATFAVVSPHRPKPDANRPQDARGFVTGEGAVLKKSPAAGAETVGRLTGGARIALLADLGRWYQVRTEKGETGFVSAEDVEKESEREAREKRAKTIAGFAPVFGLVAEDTDVLLAPFPQAPHNGRLARGAVIAIHSVDHSYYSFKTKTGDIAFVNSADVDLVPADPSKPEIKAGAGKAVKDVTVADTAPPPPEVESEPASSGGIVEATPVPAQPFEAPEAAELVTRVEPTYPERARRAGVEGMVELDVTIGPNGSVTNVEVVRGLPFGISEAAADAVRRWKYRPARGRNGPVVSRKTVRILFTLGH